MVYDRVQLQTSVSDSMRRTGAVYAAKRETFECSRRMCHARGGLLARIHYDGG